MKINTIEKLEILLFGLQAGKELDITIECGTTDHLIFGDFNGLGFRIGHDYKVDADGAEANDCYIVEGCMVVAKKEARQWFENIKPLTLSDKERGKLDCIKGDPALVNQSTAYEDCYGEQYAKEQTLGGQQ